MLSMEDYPKRIENEISLNIEGTTIKWLENILHATNELKILEVVGITYIKNDGFFSNSIKSTVRLKSGELEKLYIKVGLRKENSVESFATIYGLDQTELRAYKTILPTMAQFEENCLGSSHLKSILPKVSQLYSKYLPINYKFIIFIVFCWRHFKESTPKLSNS